MVMPSCTSFFTNNGPPGNLGLLLMGKTKKRSVLGRNHGPSDAMNFGNRTSSAVGQPLFPVRPGSVLSQFLERASGEASRCGSRMSSMSSNGHSARSPGAGISNRGRQETLARSSPQTQAFQKSLRTYQTRATSTPTTPVKGRSPRPASNASAEARRVHSRSKVHSYSQNHENRLWMNSTKHQTTAKPIISKPPISPRTQQPNNSSRNDSKTNKNFNNQNDTTYTTTTKQDVFWDQPRNPFEVEYGNPVPLGHENFARLIRRQTIVKIETTTMNPRQESSMAGNSRYKDQIDNLSSDRDSETNNIPAPTVISCRFKDNDSIGGDSESDTRINKTPPKVIICGYKDQKEDLCGSSNQEPNINSLPQVIVCGYKDQDDPSQRDSKTKISPISNLITSDQKEDDDIESESDLGTNKDNDTLGNVCSISKDTQCRDCKHLEELLEDSKNEQFYLKANVEHLRKELDNAITLATNLEDELLHSKKNTFPVLSVIPEVTETQSGFVQTDFPPEPSIAPELLERLKYPLENFISVQFPYINDTGDAKDSTTIAQQRLQFMQIALAARDGLLSELRAKLKKGHKILLRRFQSLQKSEGSSGEGEDTVIINTEVDFVLNSYRKFARYMYSYIDQSLADLKEFDRINVFETEDENSKYFHKSTIEIDGKSRTGIFIPLPLFDVHDIHQDLPKPFAVDTDFNERTPSCTPEAELTIVSEFCKSDNRCYREVELETTTYLENSNPINEDHFTVDQALESTKAWVDLHMNTSRFNLREESENNSDREIGDVNSDLIITTECLVDETIDFHVSISEINEPQYTEIPANVVTSVPTIDDISSKVNKCPGDEDVAIHVSMSEVKDLATIEDPSTSGTTNPIPEEGIQSPAVGQQTDNLKLASSSGGLAAAKEWIERHPSPIQLDIFDFTLLRKRIINPTSEVTNDPKTLNENASKKTSRSSSLVEFEKLEKQCQYQTALSETETFPTAPKLSISALECVDSSASIPSDLNKILDPANWSGYFQYEEQSKESKASIYISEMTLVDLWPEGSQEEDDKSSVGKVNDTLLDYNGNIVNIFRKKFLMPESPSISKMNLDDISDPIEESIRSTENDTDVDADDTVPKSTNSEKFLAPITPVGPEKYITVLKTPAAFNRRQSSTSSFIDHDSPLHVNTSHQSSTCLEYVILSRTHSVICVTNSIEKAEPNNKDNKSMQSIVLGGESSVAENTKKCSQTNTFTDDVPDHELLHRPVSASSSKKHCADRIPNQVLSMKILAPVALSRKSIPSEKKFTRCQANLQHVLPESLVPFKISDPKVHKFQEPGIASCPFPDLPNISSIVPVPTPQAVAPEKRNENKVKQQASTFSQNNLTPEEKATFTLNPKIECSIPFQPKTIGKSFESRNPELKHQKQNQEPLQAKLSPIVARKSTSESNIARNQMVTTKTPTRPSRPETADSTHFNRFGWKLNTGSTSAPNSRPTTPRNSSAPTSKFSRQKSRLPLPKK